MSNNPFIQQIVITIRESRYFSDIDEVELFATRLWDTYRFDIPHELKKMELWLDCHNKKKNYKRFITNWLSRKESYKWKNQDLKKQGRTL